jgi:hypothetical protein
LESSDVESKSDRIMLLKSEAIVMGHEARGPMTESLLVWIRFGAREWRSEPTKFILLALEESDVPMIDVVMNIP